MKAKKYIFKLLKIGISVLLLYFVFAKISFQDTLQLIKEGNLLLLLLSGVALFLSQWISAIRLNILLHHQKYYFYYCFGLLAGDFCWRQGWGWGAGGPFGTIWDHFNSILDQFLDQFGVPMPTNYIFQSEVNFLEIAHTNFSSSIR